MSGRNPNIGYSPIGMPKPDMPRYRKCDAFNCVNGKISQIGGTEPCPLCHGIFLSC